MTERYPFTWQMKRFGGRFVTEDTDYLLNSFTPWVKTEVKTQSEVILSLQNYVIILYIWMRELADVGGAATCYVCG